MSLTGYLSRSCSSPPLVASSSKPRHQQTRLAAVKFEERADVKQSSPGEVPAKSWRLLERRLAGPSFTSVAEEAGVTPLHRQAAKVLQLNVGLYCNQACTHCHVESSPQRTEMMDRRIAQRCIELLHATTSIATVDLTGGAPELNSQFRYLVDEARAAGKEVIDRCNLTVLSEPGQDDLAAYLASNQVHVVASLPCYSAKNVDAQRGDGVFERSISGLQLLNSLGYGQPDSGLVLDLVYNPGGAFLAPSQAKLEPAYKAELSDLFGIQFNQLFCLNNMPVKRFADYLASRGALVEYMQLLLDNFNPAAAEGLMCRDTISVRWDGRLYDCDFNQQLDLNMMTGSGGRGVSIFDLDSFSQLDGLRIATQAHCFGCTAGSGSSCQGQAA